MKVETSLHVATSDESRYKSASKGEFIESL